MHFLVGPNVLALVVGDDVEALPEGFFDAVFVVFDAGHTLCPLFALHGADGKVVAIQIWRLGL